jgi:phenylpropionate dioxygenase-like ring-hydroxylating dioxygenase large terminal subunit
MDTAQRLQTRKRIGDAAETLLDYVERNKTFQTDKIITVPAQSYTDPLLWRAEIDLIFKRVPLMLALTCEMPKPGDYKAMEVVGLPILITRDKVGTVRAFLNVCAHRWTQLVAEGHGNCPHFRFACPLHAWTYGFDGNLLAIADQAKFGPLDRTKHGLKELPCEERHGMIFACLTPGEPFLLDAYYGTLLDEYADVGLKDWTFLGRQVLEGPNWKISMSNFFEAYHLASLHPTTVAPLLVPDVMHYEGFGPNLRIAFAHREIRTLREVPRVSWGEREGQGCFSFIRFFFPNLTGSIQTEVSSSDRGFHMSKNGIATFTQTFPGSSPDKSQMVLLYACKQAPKDNAERETLGKVMDWATFDIVRDEDVASGFQIQKTLHSRAHEGLLYGQNERGNQYFQEWIDWYLKADPTLSVPVL